MLSQSMLDIEHVIMLRFRMNVGFVVYKLCDKSKLASVCLEDFFEKNKIYNFNDKLFNALAKYKINEQNFFKHKITQLATDELDAFYNFLSGEIN